MKVNGAIPGVSRLQFVLLLAGFALFLIGSLLERFSWVSLIGWLFLAMSWGTSVEIDGKKLRLCYLFGKKAVEVPIEKVWEVKAINRLTLSSLAREFPDFFLLVLSVACFSLFVVLTHPSRDYSGYTALFLVSASYLLLLSVPFGWDEIGMLAFAIPLILSILLWLIVPGAVDPMMVFIGEIGVFFTYASYYSRDYVVLKTTGETYLIALNSEVPVDVFLRTLGGRVDVQTP